MCCRDSTYFQTIENLIVLLLCLCFKITYAEIRAGLPATRFEERRDTRSVVQDNAIDFVEAECHRSLFVFVLVQQVQHTLDCEARCLAAVRLSKKKSLRLSQSKFS